MHRNLHIVEKRYVTIFRYLLLAAPLWWIAGLDFLVYPSLAIIYFSFRKIYGKMDGFCYLIILAIFYFLFRAIIYAGLGGSLYRTFAAIYNAVLLTPILIGYQMTRLHQPASDEVLPFIKPLSYVFWPVALATIFTMLWGLKNGQQSLSFPTMIGLITPPAPGLLGLHQSFSFFGADWGSGEVLPRTKVLAPYPTASALTLSILGTAAMLYYAKHKLKLVLLIEIITLTALLMTFTRTVLGGYLLGTFIAALVFAPLVGKTISIFLSFFIFLIAYLSGLFEYLENFRQGSNDLRFLNYEYAIEMVWQQNPLFGLGVKPEDQSIAGIPVGSHSTPISFFTKGGLLGLLFALALFIVKPILIWLRNVWLLSGKISLLKRYQLFSLARLTIIFLIFILFEDIDSLPFCATLVGLIFGWMTKLITKS